MATTQTVPFKLKVKKPQAQALKSFLKTIPYVEVSLDESAPKRGASRDTFVRGNYLQGENPADFAGAWSDNPERNLEAIRRKAWPIRK